jgi:hypothetical protein
MKLPIFRFARKVVYLVLIVIVLLGGIAFWFTRYPAYNRPFGLFASTCYQYGLFSKSVAGYITSTWEVRMTIDAQYLATYQYGGYCNQIDYHTHMDFINYSQPYSVYYGWMQSSISNGQWLSGTIDIPEETHYNYQLGTGIRAMYSNPCQYTYSESFYYAGRAFRDVEVPYNDYSSTSACSHYVFY